MQKRGLHRISDTPDPEREKELAAKEELGDCENEMAEYIAGTEGGLCVPVNPMR